MRQGRRQGQQQAGPAGNELWAGPATGLATGRASGGVSSKQGQQGMSYGQGRQRGELWATGRALAGWAMGKAGNKQCRAGVCRVGNRVGDTQGRQCRAGSRTSTGWAKDRVGRSTPRAGWSAGRARQQCHKLPVSEQGATHIQSKCVNSKQAAGLATIRSSSDNEMTRQQQLSISVYLGVYSVHLGLTAFISGLTALIWGRQRSSGVNCSFADIHHYIFHCDWHSKNPQLRLEFHHLFALILRTQYGELQTKKQ